MVVKDDLTVPTFTVDTKYLPDGRYRLKLSASDEKANMKGKGFKVEKELDDLVTVDKSPPEISDLKASFSEEETVVECTVNDAYSKITEGFFRVNDGEWEKLYPVDTLFDENTEQFRLKLGREEAERGDVVILRFEDERLNYVLQRVVVE